VQLAFFGLLELFLSELWLCECRAEKQETKDRFEHHYLNCSLFILGFWGFGVLGFWGSWNFFLGSFVHIYLI